MSKMLVCEHEDLSWFPGPRVEKLASVVHIYNSRSGEAGVRILGACWAATLATWISQ